MLPMSTKDHQRAPPMSYLCTVLRTQARAPTFADSPSRHLHTPGNRTCRLQRQQKRDKKVTLLFNNLKVNCYDSN